MNRDYYSYMLGRLICGDDCLVQNFKNKSPTDIFRYQIQAKDYNEGFVWGNVCAKHVFNVNKIYSYIKKNEGTFNYVILLNEKSIINLIKNKYIVKREHNSKFRPNTSLATIKSIPLRRVISFNDIELSEFLAGWFDSDGTIRPKYSELSFALDTQLATRRVPLAYTQIKLLKLLELKKKVPKLIRVEIKYPRKSIKRALIFFKNCRKLFNNVRLIESRRSKGVSVNIFLSCNVRARTNNRNVWLFWIYNVAPRFFREDKKLKFMNFFKQRKHRFIDYRINPKFYIKIANIINKNSNISIRRPYYPICEIKLKYLNKNIAKSVSRNIKNFLYSNTTVYKRIKGYVISFYMSPNNFEEFERYIMPELDKDKRIMLLNFIKNKRDSRFS